MTILQVWKISVLKGGKTAYLQGTLQKYLLRDTFRSDQNYSDKFNSKDCEYEILIRCYERFSGHTDSDTGGYYMDSIENRTNRKKTRRKRTTNLGPRLKVLNINPMDAGLKVECQMETAKQKTITFEFSTVDIVPDEISAEFVSFLTLEFCFLMFLWSQNYLHFIHIIVTHKSQIQQMSNQMKSVWRL